MTNTLWRKITTTEVLKRGWHLARLDTKQDFTEDLYSTDSFGIDLDARLLEIINRLKTNTYQPQPLLRNEVPKGPLGFRPGAVIPIQDRVVVSSIIYLIAPSVDKAFPDSVYSWRIKEPLPKKGSIFKSTDIADLPYLKKRTIRVAIDPFESWYEMWPQFDLISRRAFEDEGYKFLATSDIAAYFENIQLPILRDHLVSALPKEPQIVNLLFHFLESWAIRTVDGRAHLRGIPQGNFISSFLGNFFLLPLDEAFETFGEEFDIKYFRYMDDVRIFTRRLADARRAVFYMDRQVRQLHLNVQTAKTRIYDETRKEITQFLIDPRVDELTEMIDEIQALLKTGALTVIEKKRFLLSLKSISKEPGSNGQRITGTRGPLEGLTMRAFSRWSYAHQLLFDGYFIGRLLYEFRRNPDMKVSKRLVSAARQFPKRASIESAILDFINSEENIFEHQEAECLRAIRYLRRINSRTVVHCKERLHNKSKTAYLRMQSAYLLSRVEHDSLYLKRIRRLFESEDDPYVQVALSTVIVQSQDDLDEFVERMFLHPNNKIRDVGKLYSSVQTNVSLARDRIKHIFRKETPWMICDNMAFIYLMSFTKNDEIRLETLKALNHQRRNHPIRDIRLILMKLYSSLQTR